jgi:glycosyltransferase involved in cell wall biosynthesis
MSADLGRTTDNRELITDNEKPRASFAGFLNQTEVSKAYVAANVLVLPSESETWGLVVNEAMACGLPAIVSDTVGCAPDLIEKGRTGYVFPVGRTEVLAEKLSQLASAHQAGIDFPRARKPILTKYSVESAISGTVACLRAVTTAGFTSA